MPVPVSPAPWAGSLIWLAGLAHVLAHATSLVHGAELPPHPHRTPAVSTDQVKPQVA
jgi:hypothetical protein